MATWSRKASGLCTPSIHRAVCAPVGLWPPGGGTRSGAVPGQSFDRRRGVHPGLDRASRPGLQWDGPRRRKAARQNAQGLLVGCAIAADEASRVDRALTSQGCPAAAGLLDEDQMRCDVPGPDNRVDRNLARALRNQDMLVEVAEAPLPLGPLEERGQARKELGCLDASQAAVEQLRAREVADSRDA